MFKTFYLKYNITHNRLTRADGSLKEIVLTDKDDNLFATEFVESKGETETPVNFTSVNSFRLVCDETLSKTANRLFFQDLFNQGEDLDYEDLPNGRVTHLISLNDPAIDTYLGSKDSVDAVMEYSVIDGNSRPQTLTTEGIKIRIVPGVDYSDQATPTPSSPAYYTANEIDARVALNNLSAVIDPTVDDDGIDGYVSGSIWVNNANGKTFILVDNTTGAADWKPLGLSALEVKTLYESNADTNAFTDALLSKLSGIEANATADQTGAEIKAAYEGESDTNAFTDSEKTKLSGIEANATADQTGAEIKALYEAEGDTNAFTDSEKAKLALLDTSVGPPLQNLTELAALTEASLSDKEKRFIEDEEADYFYDAQAVSGDLAPSDQTGGTGFWKVIEATLTETPASIKSKYESNADTNAFSDSNQTKLAGIESGATADQTGAEIKTAYEGESDTNAFTDSEKSKLTGIESGATADQTGAEIKASYEGEADTNAFTDAEQSKLSGIEANAKDDQTGAEIKALYEAESNTNGFTDSEKAKLALLSTLNGPPVQDLTALTALTEASLSDKEKRFVEDEVSDYYYDSTAGSGDEAPDDQTGGTGFWIRIQSDAVETPASIKSKYESNADTNVFSDSNQTKLAGIESGATADQSDVEIKTAYENNADTNAFTDSEKTKLSGIETNAKDDQTGAEIKALYEAEANTNPFTDTEQSKLSGIESGATADQSDVEIKTAYENNADTNAFTDSEKSKLASIDAAHYGAPVQDTTALTALTEASLTDKERRYVEDESSDYFYDSTAVSGDEQPDDQTGGTGFWKQVNVGGESAASIKSKYESNADTNSFTDAEQSKLSGIEANATADQTGAEIKAAYEGESDTNAFTDTEKTKLSGIEANATADQSDVEIKTAYENNADTNAFTDTEKTKLSGIEANATADQSDVEIKTAYENNANTNALTDSLLAKLNSIDAAHYGAPVQDTTALTALTEASLTDKERRYVEDETADYFYDAQAVSGDEAPDDQTGGTGFWKKFNESDTPAGIKTKYESNADTNALTDTLLSKINGAIAVASHVTKTADYPVVVGDLGAGKHFIMGSATSADSKFELPSTTGRSASDVVAFSNFSTKNVKVVTDGTDTINGLGKERSIALGQGMYWALPIDSENAWMLF